MEVRLLQGPVLPHILLNIYENDLPKILRETYWAEYCGTKKAVHCASVAWF